MFSKTTMMYRWIWMNVVPAILILNGLYDILCGCCILWQCETIQLFVYLGSLHPTMFIEPNHSNHPVIRRLLAYWLFTYGLVRLFAGMTEEFYLDIVAAITYFLEAFCYEYERWIGQTVIHEKTTFVSVFSFILGVIVISRPFGVYGYWNLGSHKKEY